MEPGFQLLLEWRYGAGMEQFDLLVIGGGINGAAIARDAAGRRARVLLVEKDDLAGHTSSASSKLVHGGLRYLEQSQFRLVRESLEEREILLRTAPHVVRPLRFVLPHAPGMRPWWKLRAGLRLYDVLAGRKSSLPWSRRTRAPGDAAPLRPDARGRLACYWDAWADDARLTVSNAVDAAERGAEIAVRTELLSARRESEHWLAELSDGRTVSARAIVNAAGPWVSEVLARLGVAGASRVRLVKGSHIVVPRLCEGDHGYILQQPDGRVVFALPFGTRTLVGTTDVPVECPEDAAISEEEVAYLLGAANRWFVRRLGPKDIMWRYSGVRALHDDGETAAQKVTRDYRLELDDLGGAKLLSLFGGKLTTARALAAEAIDRLGIEGRKWTRWEPLPGGDIMPGFNDYLDELGTWMPQPLLLRLARSYGTRLERVIGAAASLKGLGHDYGAGLHEAELRYLVETEYARTADDVLWRRTKLGLELSEVERAAVGRALEGG
jgi:glycerol-3-phosphate dehydrogenase